MFEMYSRAARRVRNGGIRGLAIGIGQFLRYRLRPYYWQVRHRLSGDVTTVTIGDVTVELVADDWRATKRWETLMGERDVLETLLAEVHSDDVVWDIGGSWGMFATPLAATGADVTTFEPVPARVEKIKRNLAQNNLSATINEFALGAQHQDLTVAIEGDNPGGLTEDDGAVETTVRPGDSLLANGDVTPPTVLKIDVEGAEVDVLEGLSETLAGSNLRLVVIEVHRDLLGQFDSTEAEIYEYLDGFDIEVLSQRNEDNYHLIARRNPS